MKGKFLHVIATLTIVSFLTSCEQDELATLPSVDFNTSADTIMASNEVAFENLTKNADSFEWDFGDGITSTENSPVHFYNKAGIYTIRLLASSSGGQVEKTKQLLVLEPNKYVVQNNSPYTLFNLKSFNSTDNKTDQQVSHGNLSSGEKTAEIITDKDKISISFENGNGYRLTVIFPFDIENNKVNYLEIKKYTMVYIEKIKEEKSSFYSEKANQNPVSISSCF